MICKKWIMVFEGVSLIPSAGSTILKTMAIKKIKLYLKFFIIPSAKSHVIIITKSLSKHLFSTFESETSTGEIILKAKIFKATKVRIACVIIICIVLWSDTSIHIVLFSAFLIRKYSICFSYFLEFLFCFFYVARILVLKRSLNYSLWKAFTGCHLIASFLYAFFIWSVVASFVTSRIL